MAENPNRMYKEGDAIIGNREVRLNNLQEESVMSVYMKIHAILFVLRRNTVA